MTDKGREALIAQLLNQQVETYQYEISYERMVQILDGGGAFTKQEALILWQSPLQRSKYLSLRREKIRQINETIQNQFNDRVDYILAADSSEEQFSIQRMGFELEFTFNVTHWEIQIQLEKNLRELLGEETVVVLTDDQNATWLKQQVGKGYLLSAIWPLSISPREAIKRMFTLSVE